MYFDSKGLQLDKFPFPIPIHFRECNRGEVYMKRSDKIYAC